MTRLTRTAACIMVLMSFTGAASAPAWAADSGPSSGAQDTRVSKAHDNFVTLDNRTDNAVLEQSSTDVAFDRGNRVDNQNIAYAHASCTGCRTVAVAVQVLVVNGSYSYASPKNAAVAINQNCVDCVTAAYARQYMLTAAQEADIQPATWRQLSQIDRQIAEVTASNLDPASLFAQLDDLAVQFESAVQHDLTTHGGGVGHDSREVESDQS